MFQTDFSAIIILHVCFLSLCKYVYMLFFLVNCLIQLQIHLNTSVHTPYELGYFTKSECNDQTRSLTIEHYYLIYKLYSDITNYSNVILRKKKSYPGSNPESHAASIYSTCLFCLFIWSNFLVFISPQWP